MKLKADRTNEAESSFDVEGPRCGNGIAHRNFNREVRNPDNGAQRVVWFSPYAGVFLCLSEGSLGNFSNRVG